jgi:hypothetical protein
MNVFTIRTIQDKLFMLQDKIKMMEMFIAHAKCDALELDELLLDLKEQDLDDRIRRIV